MDKKAWRQKIFALQKQLTEQEWKYFSHSILQRVLDDHVWQVAKSVAVYYSIQKEVDTLALIQQGWSQGKSIYLPKCFPQERKLKFYKLESFEHLEVVYMGIPEPIPEMCEELSLEQLDLIIVPGVVYDHLGYRLGYGGGYYDRFLAHAPTNLEKLSLAFSFQVVQDRELPREVYDIPVDKIITNQETILCTRK